MTQMPAKAGAWMKTLVARFASHVHCAGSAYICDICVICG